MARITVAAGRKIRKMGVHRLATSRSVVCAREIKRIASKPKAIVPKTIEPSTVKSDQEGLLFIFFRFCGSCGIAMTR